MLTTYQRIMDEWRRRIVIDDRCVCGHDAREHDHRTLCFACDCVEFKDQNDLDRELNADHPRGWLRGGPAARRVEMTRKESSK